MDAWKIDSWRLGRRALPGAPVVSEPDGIRMVAVSEAVIRVAAKGAGPKTVVLCVDPPNVIEHYKLLMDYVAPHARVICFELPGTGYSVPKEGYRFTLDNQVRVVTELLDKLSVGRATLAFPCLTSFVAMAVARKRPDLAERFVIAQGASFSEAVKWTHRIDALGLLRLPFIGQLANWAGRKALVRRFYASTSPDDEATDTQIATSMQALGRGAECCLASDFQELRRLDGRKISGVDLPTIVVWGEGDPTHKKTDRSSIRTHLPNTQVVHFWGKGHSPDLDEPARFAQMLLGLAVTEAGLPSIDPLDLTAEPQSDLEAQLFSDDPAPTPPPRSAPSAAPAVSSEAFSKAFAQAAAEQVKAAKIAEAQAVAARAAAMQAQAAASRAAIERAQSAQKEAAAQAAQAAAQQAVEAAAAAQAHSNAAQRAIHAAAAQAHAAEQAHAAQQAQDAQQARAAPAAGASFADQGAFDQDEFIPSPATSAAPSGLSAAPFSFAPAPVTSAPPWAAATPAPLPGRVPATAIGPARVPSESDSLELDVPRGPRRPQPSHTGSHAGRRAMPGHSTGARAAPRKKKRASSGVVFTGTRVVLTTAITVTILVALGADLIAGIAPADLYAALPTLIGDARVFAFLVAGIFAAPSLGLLLRSLDFLFPGERGLLAIAGSALVGIACTGVCFLAAAALTPVLTQLPELYSRFPAPADLLRELQWSPCRTAFVAAIQPLVQEWEPILEAGIALGVASSIFAPRRRR